MLWNTNVSQRYEKMMQKDQGQKTELGSVCVFLSVFVYVCRGVVVAMKTATRTD